MTVRFIHGDALAILRSLPSESVHCCVTSPPYWGLRDYGTPGQIGLEATPDEYVARLVEVFGEVRRVLRPDGTLWLNLGDCYATAGGAGWQGKHGARANRTHTQRELKRKLPEASGLKPKDLVGIPWRTALALQADGWWLRSDIIWHKPNCMPSSVEDRPTTAHEYLFLLAKSPRYYYDHAAVAEPCVWEGQNRTVFDNGPRVTPPGTPPHRGIRRSGNKARKLADGGAGERPADHLGSGIPWEDLTGRRNRRSVWTITTQPFAEVHFATMPPALVEPCILAGCPVGGTVLDPFSGAGTVALVADRFQRNAIGIEIKGEYVAMAERRLREEASLFHGVA